MQDRSHAATSSHVLADTGVRPLNISAMRTTRRRIMSVVGSTLFGIGFFTAVAILVVGTLFALSNDPARSSLAYGLLGLNLALLVVLAAYLTIGVWSMLARRTGQPAPILHRRFVLTFSAIALAPAVLVGAFSASLLSQNIDSIFGDDVRSNLDQAKDILNTYVSEEIETVLARAEAVRNLIETNPELLSNRVTLRRVLQGVALELDIDSIYVMQRDGLILVSSESPDTPEMRIPTRAAFEQLDEGGVPALLSRDEIDYLMTLTSLSVEDDTYLYLGDYLRQNARVLSSISGINDATDDLSRFNENSRLFSRTFFLTFLETAILILMAAVILGTFLANRIIEPLGRMITASERVREGDLAARVHVERNWGEVSDLGGAFNRMTEQLSSQRSELVREHDVSERQRRFSEAVLSGVTAGVIGLSEEGRITVLNTSAQKLLSRDDAELIGQPIAAALPEFANAFAKARESLKGRADDQVGVSVNGETLTFDLRVSSYEGERAGTGWVLTFDDMTRLVAAQRHSAWREVARRIAHEIKNPLTPIQLSAERLQLKFRNTDLQVQERDILGRCTDTILRAVGNLERMVDEFSSFARMPTPTFDLVDVDSIIRDAVAEQSVAFPDVSMRIRKKADASVLADERLLGQSITNLLKNAAESTERALETALARHGRLRVDVGAELSGGKITIFVEDNGVGWPDSNRERLLEPYTTTRRGGTGLGLAIVNRIAEDHGGSILLGTPRQFKRGARVELVLPSPLGLDMIETATESFHEA